jgi:5-methyltetrahydropteroyltriglutamate--homocysteine methyltransferase
MCGALSPDESAALTGDYRPLLPWLERAPVGTLFLELCTPRAGEIEVIADLPRRIRVGVGVLNQKARTVDPPDVIARRMERAIRLFSAERVVFTPDCGFATFADNPVASAQNAEAALRAIRAAADLARGSAGPTRPPS